MSSVSLIHQARDGLLPALVVSHGQDQLPLRRQAGQALLEGMVAMLVLLGLWVAGAWLYRYQDMALQAAHASRFAAFVLTRDAGYASIEPIRQSYFSGPGHQWKDRRGRDFLGAGRGEVTLEITRGLQLPPGAQPGLADSPAALLRQQWQLEDQGVASAAVKVNMRQADMRKTRETTQPMVEDTFGLGLRQFDSYPAPLVRHTAILLDAGHASDDQEVQARVALSSLGWRAAAEVSHGLGKTVSSAMNKVDGAWRRPKPVFDWLGPWQGAIPEHHLR